MFESEKVINQVFEACYQAYKASDKFNVEKVITELALPKPENDQDTYWQNKNVTNALNILEKSKLISGTIEPEYTNNLRLLKEVRYGKVTQFGKLTILTPKFFRYLIICIFLQKNKLISLLGVLSFAKLAHSAYLGLGILSGWLEYIAAAIILYVLYLLISKAIND